MVARPRFASSSSVLLTTVGEACLSVADWYDGKWDESKDDANKVVQAAAAKAAELGVPSLAAAAARLRDVSAARLTLCRDRAEAGASEPEVRIADLEAQLQAERDRADIERSRAELWQTQAETERARADWERACREKEQNRFFAEAERTKVGKSVFVDFEKSACELTQQLSALQASLVRETPALAKVPLADCLSCLGFFVKDMRRLFALFSDDSGCNSLDGDAPAQPSQSLRSTPTTTATPRHEQVVVETRAECGSTGQFSAEESAVRATTDAPDAAHPSAAPSVPPPAPAKESSSPPAPAAPALPAAAATSPAAANPPPTVAALPPPMPLHPRQPRQASAEGEARQAPQRQAEAEMAPEQEMLPALLPAALQAAVADSATATYSPPPPPFPSAPVPTDAVALRPQPPVVLDIASPGSYLEARAARRLFVSSASCLAPTELGREFRLLAGAGPHGRPAWEAAGGGTFLFWLPREGGRWLFAKELGDDAENLVVRSVQGAWTALPEEIMSGTWTAAAWGQRGAMFQLLILRA